MRNIEINNKSFDHKSVRKHKILDPDVVYDQFVMVTNETELETRSAITDFDNLESKRVEIGMAPLHRMFVEIRGTEFDLNHFKPSLDEHLTRWEEEEEAIATVFMVVTLQYGDAHDGDRIANVLRTYASRATADSYCKYINDHNKLNDIARLQTEGAVEPFPIAVVKEMKIQ